MRYHSFRYARISALVRALGLAIVSLMFAVGLAASAAAQPPIPVWRAAAPINRIFIEHFGSGLAPEVDLRPKIRRFGLPIRNQGNRGTCTVFATTFLIEYQKAGMPGASGAHILSEEYLNWAGNKVAHEASDGGFFTKFIPGYEAWGVSGARQMSYRPTYNPTHPATPSKLAIKSAQAMFSVKYPFVILKVWDNTRGMTRAELQRALATLRSGRPVATGIWWLSTFSTVNVHGVPLLKDYPRSANSNADPSKNPMFDGHSIDLVGFRESPAFPGGGYFIFRNSFGRSFGDAGYGFVSFQHLRAYSNDAIAIAQQPWHPMRPTTKN
jgi:papain like protease